MWIVPKNSKKMINSYFIRSVELEGLTIKARMDGGGIEELGSYTSTSDAEKAYEKLVGSYVFRNRTYVYDENYVPDEPEEDEQDDSDADFNDNEDDA